MEITLKKPHACQSPTTAAIAAFLGAVAFMIVFGHFDPSTAGTGPALLHVSHVRPDTVRLHFSGSLTAASVSNRDRFHVSGTANVTTAVPHPVSSATPASVELTITGLREGNIYSIAADSLTAPDGSTTEPASLTFTTPAPPVQTSAWGAPADLAGVQGSYATVRAAASGAMITLGCHELFGTSETLGLNIYSSVDGGGRFTQKSLGESASSPHLSTIDTSWPDLGAPPVLNPGAYLVSSGPVVVAAWTSIRFDEGRLHVAISQDSGVSFPDRNTITLSLGQSRAAQTPCVAIEEDLTKGRHLIFVTYTLSTLATVGTARVTRERAIETVRIVGPLDSLNSRGKLYEFGNTRTLFGPVTVYSGTDPAALTLVSSAIPAAPQALLVNHSLHLAYTALDLAGRHSRIIAGRYDFDHARGTLKDKVLFRDLTPYSQDTFGPRLIYTGTALLLTAVSADRFGQASIVTMASKDGGVTFEDAVPITGLMLDFEPWAEEPVFRDVFDLLVQDPWAAGQGDGSVLLAFKDLRPDPDLKVRTVHRILLAHSPDHGSSWGILHSLGRPGDSTLVERASRAPSLVTSGKELLAFYAGSEINMDGSSSGFARLYRRKLDSTPPRLSTAWAINPTTIMVRFDEPLDSAAASSAASFDLGASSARVFSAVLSEDRTEVTLNTSELLGGQTYTLTVKGIADQAGNIVATQDSATMFSVPPSASPAAGWTDPVRISFEESGVSTSPRAAFAGQEAFVFWSDSRDTIAGQGRPNTEIYMRRSPNGGISWEPELRLTNSLEESAKPFAFPSASGIMMVWQDFRDKNYEVYFGRATGGGSWFGGTRLTRNTSPSVTPGIAAKDSFAAVAWADNSDGDNDIYLSTTADAGKTWSPIWKVSDNNSESTDPSVAIGSAGEIYVAWQDDRELVKSVLVARWSPDGSAATDAMTVSGSLEAYSPALAADESGRICVFFTAVMGLDAAGKPLETIQYAYSHDRAQSFSPPLGLSPHAGRVGGLSAAAGGDMIYAAYSDDRNGTMDVFLHSTTDGGALMGGGVNLTAPAPGVARTGSTRPSVAVSGDMVAVAFESDRHGPGEIYFTVNSGVAPEGPRISVGTFGNPADPTELMILVRSTADLAAPPTVTVTPPGDSAGTTVEAMQVRERVWLSRTRKGYTANPGLVRVSVLGRDKEGREGIGSGASYLARIAAGAATAISPDGILAYELDGMDGSGALFHMSEWIPSGASAEISGQSDLTLSDELVRIGPAYSIRVTGAPGSADSQTSASTGAGSNTAWAGEGAGQSPEVRVVLRAAAGSGVVKALAGSASGGAGGTIDSGAAESQTASGAAKVAGKTAGDEDPGNRAGIYYISREGNTVFAGNAHSACVLSEPGSPHFLAMDVSPPTVSGLTWRWDYASGEAILEGSVEDSGSGPLPGGPEITIDGLRLKVDSDPEGKRFVCRLRATDLPDLRDSSREADARPEALITVTDRAGNVSMKTAALAAAPGIGIRAFVCWPNPVADSATFRVDSDLPLDLTVLSVRVYDLSGAPVQTIRGDLFSQRGQAAGFFRYEAQWNLITDQGRSLSNGTYPVRLRYSGSAGPGGGEYSFKMSVLR